MGLPGRKPKPTELRILEGVPGHRPLNENRPKPAPIKPDCPDWLLPEARIEWDRVADHLAQLGLLTIIDRAALAAYCQAWARWREAEEAISEHGVSSTTDAGNIVQRPEVSIARNYLNTVRQFATEFGMTPSSRGRIEVAGDDGADDEDLD
jgi:P27 family predicted phage terminase small subunit